MITCPLANLSTKPPFVSARSVSRLPCTRTAAASALDKELESALSVPQPSPTRKLFGTGWTVPAGVLLLEYYPHNRSTLMQKKSAEEMIEELAQAVHSGFEHVDQELKFSRGSLGDITERLGRIEYLLTGQEGRLTALEDKMRQVATR